MAAAAPLFPECELQLDPYAVRTGRAEVEAFARATGWTGPIDRVPFSFPFTWLTGPVPRGAILRLIGSGQNTEEHTGAALLPVHESQTFESRREWRMDETYRLSLVLRRESEPARLILRGTVSTLEDESCATLETVLRLVTIS
ncbi:hypothetical protein [Beijerinckia mobilis]|uniref:hypothetical protein n=1 Tax=Beijerinckia mobilis TaxID=231434 RepID=UPI000556CF93|nr:hypothetical protein [Beijerinckia mobilis]